MFDQFMNGECEMLDLLCEARALEISKSPVQQTDVGNKFELSMSIANKLCNKFC